MKITIETENDEEIKKVEEILRNLKPSKLQTKRAGKTAKINKFFGYIQLNPIPVDKVIIPDRAERNAR